MNKFYVNEFRCYPPSSGGGRTFAEERGVFDTMEEADAFAEAVQEELCQVNTDPAVFGLYVVYVERKSRRAV